MILLSAAREVCSSEHEPFLMRKEPLQCLNTANLWELCCAKFPLEDPDVSIGGLLNAWSGSFPHEPTAISVEGVHPRLRWVGFGVVWVDGVWVAW